MQRAPSGSSVASASSRRRALQSARARRSQSSYRDAHRDSLQSTGTTLPFPVASTHLPEDDEGQEEGIIIAEPGPRPGSELDLDTDPEQ